MPNGLDVVRWMCLMLYVPYTLNVVCLILYVMTLYVLCVLDVVHAVYADDVVHAAYADNAAHAAYADNAICAIPVGCCMRRTR